jgi:penicillin-insensitive murein endopeptidase
MWSMDARVIAAVAAAAVIAGSGCAALGVVDDGTSISWGKANRGTIINPARLPDDGDGYRVPKRWSERGIRYGTDELVDLIVQVSRRFALVWPDSRVTIADLSPLRGGPSKWHRSHQSGRDVDLVFFATDETGRPVDLEDMHRFDAEGRSLGGTPRLIFDTPKNWSLVRAIVEHPGAPVQHVFVYEPLTQRMLDHARAIGEPEAIIDRARELLKQPGDSAPHDDHFHVRILCSPGDYAYGCRDYGIFVASTKKLPELGSVVWGAWPSLLKHMVLAPTSAMLAVAGLPVLR